MSLGDDEPGASDSVDCGPSALYNLSRLLGRPLELDAIRSRLPSTRRGNFSMEELQKSALACGLRLRGVLLAKSEERAIDRPMLVFLNRGEHGHFLVLRPVGTTGKLVQVVDSVNPPAVIDKTALFAAKSWTGLALIPDEPRSWVLPARIAAAVVLVLGFLIFFVRKGRSLKPSVTTGSASV
jgi:ABC-type bacteriocin/lantibiotic exporter with double-glycine peptidase domain